jgi:hypothetical protein
MRKVNSVNLSIEELDPQLEGVWEDPIRQTQDSPSSLPSLAIPPSLEPSVNKYNSLEHCNHTSISLFPLSEALSLSFYRSSVSLLTIFLSLSPSLLTLLLLLLLLLLLI